MVDRCVCCGDIVPEGTMVCVNCRIRYMEPDNRRGKKHSGYIPAKKDRTDRRYPL